MGWPSLTRLGPLAAGGSWRRRMRAAASRGDHAVADRRPRVLFVAPVAVEGGVAEVLLGLVRRADAGGYDTRVVFLRDGPVASRLRAHAPTVLHAGRLRRPDAFVRTVWALASIVRRTRPDVVVAMEPSAHLYTAIPASLQRVPPVLMYHGLPDKRHPPDRLAGRLPSAAAVMNSQFVMDRARHLTRAPLYLLYPGIDVDAVAAGDGAAVRERFGIPREAPLVGIIGRLQAWKGQELFLEAAAIIGADHPETHFVIVGGADMGWEDREYPLMLRHLAKQLGIADRVTFTGHSHEVADWLATMDVAVNASRDEPYGLMVCEALAAGRALVSVDQGGPLELVEHERTGLLTPRDARSLASGLSRLLTDDALREQLGNAGRERARERMSDVRMAQQFGAILSTVTRTSSRTRRGHPRLRVVFLAPVSEHEEGIELLLLHADPGPDALYESLVITFRHGPLLGRLAAADISHVLLDAPGPRRMLRTARAIRQLDRIIARWEPDLVFSTEAFGHFHAVLPAARHGVSARRQQAGIDFDSVLTAHI